MGWPNCSRTLAYSVADASMESVAPSSSCARARRHAGATAPASTWARATASSASTAPPHPHQTERGIDADDRCRLERAGGHADDAVVGDQRDGYVETSTHHECLDVVPGCRARRRRSGPPRTRERMARRAQLLARGTERDECDIVERGAREEELAEQPEHQWHRRRRVGVEEVAPADLLERVGDVDLGLRQHTTRGALERVERLAVDSRHVTHGASRARGRPGSGAGSRRSRRRWAPSD